MTKLKLESHRTTEYCCSTCDSITTLKSLVMKPKPYITCVDCGSKVFEAGDVSMDVLMSRLNASILSNQSERSNLLWHLGAFSLGDKIYRDATEAHYKILATQNEIIRSRINALTTIKRK